MGNSLTFPIAVVNEWNVGSINFTPNKTGLLGSQVSQKTYTSADLLSLSGGVNSLVLVPAPGAGLLVVPARWALNYKFGTTPYVVGSSDCAIEASFAAAFAANSVPLGNELTGFLDQTSNQTHSDTAGSLQAASSGTINQPMILKLVGTTPTLAGGDGTLEVTVWYSIIAAQ